MEILNDERVRAQTEAHPHRLLFASLSGAHLYGFPSVDSDVDIRGAHVLPAESMLGLNEPTDTYELMDVIDGLEVDVVTYDLKKFCALLLKKNGNVLEQAVSPLVVETTDEHLELRALAEGCVTKHHAHHYRGMTKNRLRAVADEPKIKPLLYAFRAVLTGIHLMRSGECQPNLLPLIEEYDLPEVHELVARKAEAERGMLDPGEASGWVTRVDALLERLDEEFEKSTLPETPPNTDAVEEFLVRQRMAT